MGAPALSVSAVGRLWGGHARQTCPCTSWGPDPTADSCPAPGAHPGPCASGPAPPGVPCPSGPAPRLARLWGASSVPTHVLPQAGALTLRTRNVFPPLHLSKSYLSSQDTPQMSFQMSSSRVIFRSYKSGRVGLPLKASVVPTELPMRPEGPARPPRRALATACPALRALLSPRGAAPPVLHEASSVSAAKSEFKYDRI